MKRYYLILLIAIIFILAGIVYPLKNPAILSYLPFFNLLPENLQSRLINKPQIVSIAKPVPVEIATYHGTVTSFNNSILAINSKEGPKTFNISQTQDIQGVVSGTIAGGDIITVKTTLDDLKVGLEVYLIVQKGTNIVSGLYIFR